MVQPPRCVGRWLRHADHILEVIRASHNSQAVARNLDGERYLGRSRLIAGIENNPLIMRRCPDGQVIDVHNVDPAPAPDMGQKHVGANAVRKSQLLEQLQDPFLSELIIGRRPQWPSTVCDHDFHRASRFLSTKPLPPSGAGHHRTAAQHSRWNSKHEIISHSFWYKISLRSYCRATSG
jgi:hypothetical protein